MEGRELMALERTRRVDAKPRIVEAEHERRAARKHNGKKWVGDGMGDGEPGGQYGPLQVSFGFPLLLS